ncbi:MAG: hypothetical protein QXU81_00080 [Candidatus Bathyarchaeia archaeon]
MHVTRIYVERLKSFGDYSNRCVGLEAMLNEEDNLREAYLRLASEAETLLEIQNIETDKQWVDLQRKDLEDRVEKLRQAKKEYEAIRDEVVLVLSELAKKLEEIETLAEQKHLKLGERVLEKIREIRRAIQYFEDP